ncbi:hypothetical protein, partial [Nocardia cyriacigeorgica]|uniref:hypothetical protein n=1 Tax=Nocardia cyriacigeorgica TaxID=135487 RepID=UPI002456E646
MTFKRARVPRDTRPPSHCEGGSGLVRAEPRFHRPGQRGTLTMNATIHPTACTTPGCTNPATGTL